ncbi:uncharacterized protein [Solanum lycopersicum]|uniref:uncharacterized protein n=1 Tax=Solanum lycopersicum TaxID=4081 RepID=UPI003749DB83
MDKYVTRSKIGYPSSSSTNPSTALTIAPKIQQKIFISDVDLESLEADLAIRKPIAEYNPNIRDDIRRYYILKNPCQPKDHKFPKTKFGKEMRQFFPNWFKDRLSFHGHDESRSSSNRGIFLELLRWYGDLNKDVGSIILEKALKNEMMCSPSIQKDIVDFCSKETIKSILEDLDGDYFGILVDESKDISRKEKMTLVLRYVNKEGKVIERFVGIVHVSVTSACSLKEAIYSFLSVHSLSPPQIRGQGYDGANNMQGHLNGLKTFVFNETPSAYCIHCFAHQLQLTLVALAKKDSNVDDFFA